MSSKPEIPGRDETQASHRRLQHTLTEAAHRAAARKAREPVGSADRELWAGEGYGLAFALGALMAEADAHLKHRRCVWCRGRVEDTQDRPLCIRCALEADAIGKFRTDGDEK